MQGTGDYATFDTADQVAMAERAAHAMALARLAKAHLWVATVAYRIADPTNAHGVLDHESLFTPPALGCMICEQEYRPGMERTRCAGDPA